MVEVFNSPSEASILNSMSARTTQNKKDPNLWMVKCVLGTEKETLIRLMNEVIFYQETEEPLQIQSIVVPEHVKG